MRRDPQLAPLLGAALAVLTTGSLIAASVIGASSGSRSEDPLEAFSGKNGAGAMVLPETQERDNSSDGRPGSPGELLEETVTAVADQLGAPVTTDPGDGVIAVPDLITGDALAGLSSLATRIGVTGDLSDEVSLSTSDATQGTVDDLGLASKKSEDTKAPTKLDAHNKGPSPKGDDAKDKSQSKGKSKGHGKSAPSKSKSAGKPKGSSPGKSKPSGGKKKKKK